MYRKCLPSGRNCGHLWATSWRDSSSVVTGVGTPPDADTRYNLFEISGVKMITPSRFHEAPPPVDVSHSVCGGPPATSIFLSLPPAKKPMKWLSGDQNGNAALSVPGKGCIVSESNERSQRKDFPEESLTLIARRRPSGEIAGTEKDACSVGEIRKRMVCASSGTRRK